MSVYNMIIKSLNIHGFEYGVNIDNYSGVKEIFVQTTNKLCSRVFKFDIKTERLISCHNVYGTPVEKSMVYFSIIGLKTGQFTNISYHEGWRLAAESQDNKFDCTGKASPSLDEDTCWEDTEDIYIPWEGDKGYNEYEKYIDSTFQYELKNGGNNNGF